MLRAEHSFICLNAFPYSSGHVMIVPYAHQETLAALEQAAALEMMTLAQRTDAVLRQVYQPQGINMGIEPGSGSGGWDRGTPAYACAAALAGRFQLHDGDCGDAGAARNTGYHLATIAGSI